MEKDIKILEELLKEGFSAMCPLEVQAIENLIKGYRELEERIIFLTNLLCMSNEKYIEKSKIREKIEKLEREFDFYAGRCHHEWQDGEFDGEVCDEIATKILVLKGLLKEEI